MVNDKYKPQRRYDAEHAVHVPIKLNRKTDADIIALLEKQPSKQGYIKSALRAIIKTEEIENEEN